MEEWWICGELVRQERFTRRGADCSADQQDPWEAGEPPFREAPETDNPGNQDGGKSTVIKGQ